MDVVRYVGNLRKVHHLAVFDVVTLHLAAGAQHALQSHQPFLPSIPLVIPPASILF